MRTDGTTPEATWLQPATSSVISRRRRPVSSSNRTAPSEKMSVRRSSGACIACSGDMYERFPLRLPTTERSWRRLARPKSDSFTSPASEMRTFDGVTSRWMRPSGCPSCPLQLVREVQPLRQLRGDVQRQHLGDDLAHRGDLLDDHAQVVALDELQHDEVLAVLGDPEVVNLHDVAVRERRVDARLGEQHLDEALVLREVREDPLDGDELLEAFGRDDAAFEDLGHAAHGDQLEQLVLAEFHGSSPG